MRKSERFIENLLATLFHGIANNLSLLLAIGFIWGIGHTLDRIETMIRDAGKTATETAASLEPVPESVARDNEDHSLSEESRQRIEQYYRCTFRDYREENYYACVRDGSELWKAPYKDSGAGNSV